MTDLTEFDDDVLYDVGPPDIINALGGDDSIIVYTDGFQIFGGTGHDYLIVRAGDNNALHGGDGDDQLDLGDSEQGSTATNSLVFGDAGNDIINNYANPSTLDGGDGDDQIVSVSGSSTLLGGAGNDRLEVFYGNNALYGGTGDDDYYIDNVSDAVFENAGEGIDTINTTVSFALPENFENLFASQVYAPVTFTGNGGNNIIRGGYGYGDTLIGGDGDDDLDGGGSFGQDTLDGGAGNDIFRFGNGNDLAVGGIGDDNYVFEDWSGQIVEEVDGGTDTIYGAPQVVDLSNRANIENLTGLYSGGLKQTLLGNALDNVITDFAGSVADELNGREGNDTLRSFSGADKLIGGDGDDIYEAHSGAAVVVVETATGGNDTFKSVIATIDLSNYANIENLAGISTTAGQVLIGSGTDNQITGSIFGDTLDGGAGNDTLIGGKGDDTYVLGDESDVVTEVAGEGIDTITSLVTRSLANTAYLDIENLTLLGIATDATGNALDNILTGNDGNNVLDGGEGIDSLIGSLGDDTYVLDNEADVVTEVDGEGTDIVNSSASFTLSANVETLVLTGTFSINGTGNAMDNIITGNDGNNVLDGGIGNDGLIGGLGDDTYVLGDEADAVTEVAGQGIDTITSLIARSLADTAYLAVENLTLTGTSAIYGTGNALANMLTGNSAANTLNGATGTDRLVGGSGNDTYVTDGGDTIVEAAGGGTDLVQSTDSHTLGSNIERLSLTGTTAISGKGNTLANTIVGNAAKNALTGLSGNDTMSGGSGNDLIIGGTGRDVMSGNAGNDVFDFNLLSESGKTSTTRDVIRDFAVKFDDINLATIDASTKAAGNQAFKFISTQTFHKVAGEVRFQKYDSTGTASDKTIISGDVNGDGLADFSIELTGLKGLTSTDFIL